MPSPTTGDVIENQKNRLLEEIIRVARKLNAPIEQIQIQ